MKKLGVLLVSCLLVIGVVFGLVACNDDNSEESGLPGSAYEKVMFAFDGVESSFKEIKGSQASNGGSKIFAASAADALATINGVYTAGDGQGDVIDELEYDQPPMIQFQYLKAVLEKMGEGYSFGTKYYYDVTGTLYADIAGNEKKSHADGDGYKYNYSFVLAIEIDIDENDLITADVSFDIKVTQGATEYTTVWYVGMKLDYDMNNLTPNYTLEMMTDEDEINLPSRNCYTLENDYVQVKDNKIEEWRKFCFETDRKVVKDATHSTFDSYINEGIGYSVDTTKWYKNANLNKITQMNDTKARMIANALFDLGLNSTDINGEVFLRKNGVSHNSIKEIYDEISEIWGDDIIYDIVIDEDTHRSGGNGQASEINGITIREGNGANNFGDRQWVVKNVTFGELLTDPEAWMDENKSRAVLPVVYSVGRSGNLLGPVDPTADIDFFVVVNDMEVAAEESSKVADVLLALGEPEEFVIKITLGNFFATFGNSVRINSDVIEEARAGKSTDLIEEVDRLGFPVCKDARITKTGPTEYNLYDLDSGEYTELLKQYNFIYTNSDGSILGKANGNDFLQARFYFGEETRIQLQLKENPFEDWATEEITAKLNGVVTSFPEPKGENLFYEFNRENGGLSVTVCGMTEQIREQYKQIITGNGWTIVGDNGTQEVIRIVKEDIGVYYELNFDEGDYDIVDISFNYRQYTMKQLTYSVNGGEAKTFPYISYGDWDEYSSTYFLYHYDYMMLKAGDTVTFVPVNFTPDSISMTNADNYGTLSGHSYTVNNSGVYKVCYYDRNWEENNVLDMNILPYGNLNEYSCDLIIHGTPNENPQDVTDNDRNVILSAFKRIFGTATIDGRDIDVSTYVTITAADGTYLKITFYSTEKDPSQVSSRIQSIIGELGGENYQIQSDIK